MSASPGDPQPVFDLIVRHADKLCDGRAAGLFEFDGKLVHLRAVLFGDAGEREIADYRAMFPMAPSRGSNTCRAILDKQVVHTRDYQNDPEIHSTVDPFHGKGIGVSVATSGAPNARREGNWCHLAR